MGVISDRKRKRRLRQIGRCAALAGVAALIALTAASCGIAGRIGTALEKGVQVFSVARSAQDEVHLAPMTVFALQLGVFDDEERALSEVQRLKTMGVRCMIWKKARLRLISDTAPDRGSLDMDTAKGLDVYIIEEKLDEMRLRIEADARDIAGVKALLRLPDESLRRMMAGSAVSDEILRIRPLAEAALSAYPEHALYSDLAGNLISWCDMMQPLGDGAEGYGKAAMFALCRELRQALSAASTASAQRTPSTAADVMPPA